MFVSANTRSINYPQSWVNVGETIQLSISGNSSATWSSSNPAIATVSSSGEVTGVSRGNVTITAVCDDYNGSSETFTTYIDVYDNRGIVNGEEYYIMNTATDKVLSLASSSTANNTVINISARGTSTTKQWKLTQQSTGKYTFVSMYNSTTKGMYASSDDVYLYTVGSSATHFEIERVNSGIYEGTYMIRYNGKYLVANSSNDVYLTTVLNSKCYWSFSRVDKRYGEIYSFNYTYVEDGTTKTYNSTENDSKFCTVIHSIGYTTVANQNAAALNAYIDLRANADIFVYRGHGGTGTLYFYNSSGGANGRLVANYNLTGGKLNYYNISSLVSEDDDGNEIYASLSSLRCVLYLGCNTGTGSTTSNLVDVTYKKGAHFALGTTKTMYTSNNDTWLGHFLDAINNGNNIGDAIDYANDKTGSIKCPYTKADGTESEETVGIFPSYYVGDIYQFLN